MQLSRDRVVCRAQTFDFGKLRGMIVCIEREGKSETERMFPGSRELASQRYGENATSVREGVDNLLKRSGRLNHLGDHVADLKAKVGTAATWLEAAATRVRKLLEARRS